MRVRLVGTIAAIGIWLTLSGCATLVNGRTEKVTIDSSPPGADVLVDSDQHYTTPITLDLKRKDMHTLVFDKAGYQEDQEDLTSSTSGWIWVNFLLGGIVGIMVDESTGASNKLSSDSVNVTLVPTSQQATPSTPTSSGQSQEAAAPSSQGAASNAAEIPQATNAAGNNAATSPPP